MREAPVVLQQERNAAPACVFARLPEGGDAPGVAVVIRVAREGRLLTTGGHELGEVGARRPAPAEGSHGWRPDLVGHVHPAAEGGDLAAPLLPVRGDEVVVRGDGDE